MYSQNPSPLLILTPCADVISACPLIGNHLIAASRSALDSSSSPAMALHLRSVSPSCSRTSRVTFRSSSMCVFTSVNCKRVNKDNTVYVSEVDIY